MGMTIDEAISWIITISEHEGEDIPIYDTDVEAIKMAVSTMRKYQKIVGIVSLNDEEFKQCGLKELKEILEVIADGTINSSDCV